MNPIKIGYDFFWNFGPLYSPTGGPKWGQSYINVLRVP